MLIRCERSVRYTCMSTSPGRIECMLSPWYIYMQNQYCSNREAAILRPQRLYDIYYIQNKTEQLVTDLITSGSSCAFRKGHQLQTILRERNLLTVKLASSKNIIVRWTPSSVSMVVAVPSFPIHGSNVNEAARCLIIVVSIFVSILNPFSYIIC